jgi:hypothetical protein
MSKTSEISRRRTVAHEELLERNSKVYRAFLDLERAAFADGALRGLCMFRQGVKVHFPKHYLLLSRAFARYTCYRSLLFTTRNELKYCR